MVTSFHLGGLFLDVPEGRLQASLGEQAVLKALQEVEEGRMVGKDDGGVCNSIVANQRHPR